MMEQIAFLTFPRYVIQRRTHGRRTRIETGRLSRAMDGRENRHVQRWSDESDRKENKV